ncbi:MAG: hypothetical protein R2854_03580 [Caldilineaceae bacterium]
MTASRLNDGWLFHLPGSWTTGNVTLQLEVDPHHSCHTDNALGNNTLSRTVNFQNQPPVCVDRARAHPQPCRRSMTPTSTPWSTSSTGAGRCRTRGSTGTPTPWRNSKFAGGDRSRIRVTAPTNWRTAGASPTDRPTGTK